MSGLFVLLFLFSLILLPLGIIKPSLFQRLTITTRKKALAVFGSLLIGSFVLFGITSPSTTNKPEVTQSTQGASTQSAPSVDSQNPTIEKVSAAPTAKPTLTPTPTRKPTPIPTIKIYPTATPTPVINSFSTTPPNTGLSNDDYYTNSDGNEVHSPAYSNTVPSDATAICRDGTYSFSQHHSGTCSGHGGVAQWL